MTRPISLSRFPAVLNHNDLAQILGEEKETILAMCRRGDIPAQKVGKKWCITKEAFTGWLNGNTIACSIANILIEKLDYMINELRIGE